MTLVFKLLLHITRALFSWWLNQLAEADDVDHTEAPKLPQPPTPTSEPLDYSSQETSPYAWTTLPTETSTQNTPKPSPKRTVSTTATPDSTMKRITRKYSRRKQYIIMHEILRPIAHST